jgi:hypothetical protein
MNTLLLLYLNHANLKIARLTGLMSDGDLDLNDTVLNERHIHNNICSPLLLLIIILRQAKHY